MAWWKECIDVYLQLSTKGSGTGNVTVGGLPFTSRAEHAGAYAVRLIEAASGTQDSGIYASMGGSSTTITITRGESGGNTISLTDANITNTTGISISGVYEA